MKLKIQSGEEFHAAGPDWKEIRNRLQPRSAAYAVRSLATVADMLGLSRQRVHEIEAGAINKLRHAYIREMPSLELRRDENGRVCGLTEMEFDFPA